MLHIYPYHYLRYNCYFPHYGYFLSNSQLGYTKIENQQL
ncbi:hypothetical protein Nizo2891_2564 [Lactiplantibacillus plantarum]|nr:hypothetical protein Nizo2891_2564 [Lactiplantibacillus plantarum]